MQVPPPLAPPVRVRSPLRRCALVLLATVLGLALLAALACRDDPGEPPPPTATATSPAATATPHPAPDPSPTPTPDRRDELDDDGPASERILDELRDRSFRQFEPHRDGDPRKAVILDFFGPSIVVWAQYAEGAHAVTEWRIHAREYRVEWDAGGAEATIHFENIRYVQEIPEPCMSCVDVARFSISIRDVFDPARIAFRLNDPDGALPSPFPVFGDWTRFSEDEYVD